MQAVRGRKNVAKSSLSALLSICNKIIKRFSSAVHLSAIKTLEIYMENVKRFHHIELWIKGGMNCAIDKWRPFDHGKRWKNGNKIVIGSMGKYVAGFRQTLWIFLQTEPQNDCTKTPSSIFHIVLFYLKCSILASIHSQLNNGTDLACETSTISSSSSPNPRGHNKICNTHTVWLVTQIYVAI